MISIYLLFVNGFREWVLKERKVYQFNKSMRRYLDKHLNRFQFLIINYLFLKQLKLVYIIVIRPVHLRVCPLDLPRILLDLLKMILIYVCSIGIWLIRFHFILSHNCSDTMTRSHHIPFQRGILSGNHSVTINSYG